MTMWCAYVPGPDELHDRLSARLANLEQLLPRLSDDVESTAVSTRELMQARSSTALSYRLSTRLHSEANSGAAGELDWQPSRPSDAFFGHPELLEHALSFIMAPAQLALVGGVCSSWYLASRMHTLWEAQLRASGRLIGPDGSALPMPQEDEHTLFETASRIERYDGCRPVEDAGPPAIGKIDRFVDDLAAYEVCGEITENGVSTAVVERLPARGASYVANHHSRGRVTIRALNTHQSRLYAGHLASGRPFALATSAHLQPTLQAIVSSTEPPTVHLVQPAVHMPLEQLLKKSGMQLDERHAHAIFCQLAHALKSVHEQCFFHGAVLLSSVLIRDPAEANRLPYAVLDYLHLCKSLHPPGATAHGGAASQGDVSRGERRPALLEESRTVSGLGGLSVASAIAAAATPVGADATGAPDTATVVAAGPGLAAAGNGAAGGSMAGTPAPLPQQFTMPLPPPPHDDLYAELEEGIHLPFDNPVAAQMTDGTVHALFANMHAQHALHQQQAATEVQAAMQPVVATVAPLPPPLVVPLQQPMTPQVERANGGRTFLELITWGWAAYERLGTLITGHPVDLDLSHRGGMPPGRELATIASSYLAADVCDLGRLLLRLVLQPYKVRAQTANNGAAPMAAAANPMAAAAGTAAAGLPAGPPDASVFPPPLQLLLLRMLHPNAKLRPTVQEVLRSEWVREPYPGVCRPLCCCWKLADRSKGSEGCANVVASDLRLLRRRLPPITQLNLANSPLVTDEWLEVLAQHADTLKRLDLTGCVAISSSSRPLEALRQLPKLEVLRLPAERWDEHDLADALAALPLLTALDKCTHADIRKARDDFKAQCDILSNARLPPRRK